MQVNKYGASRIRCGPFVAFLCVAFGIYPGNSQRGIADTSDAAGHERPATRGPCLPDDPPAGAMPRCEPIAFGPYVSIQVNVDSDGCNILGDAANEPSIAVNPLNPDNLVIGWRQFDSVVSNFREAGMAFTFDGGSTWQFNQTLADDEFHSDPVLAADVTGTLYYLMFGWIHNDSYLLGSIDGGLSWDGPVVDIGDKPWMAIDDTDGIGVGNIYIGSGSGSGSVIRSTDDGVTWDVAALPSSFFIFQGTIAVSNNGGVYAVGRLFEIAQSNSAQDPTMTMAFDQIADLEGGTLSNMGPNPWGLLGQPWIAVDRSGGPMRDNLYVLGSSGIPESDSLDVIFYRSTDGGATWTGPIRVNDDPVDNGAWQWFAMMDVAPNGRMDAVWNDTRNDSVGDYSELYYSYSHDGGETWAPNVQVSPAFNHFIGYADNEEKLGDYYDLASDNDGVNVAYAATFNGEQDVYYLRLAPDCNGNGAFDYLDIDGGASFDCDGNRIPDECERDCNGNGIADACDVSSGNAVDENGNGVPDECSDIVFVDASATGNNDGSSWQDAYTDLQDGLVHAQKGFGRPMVWVAKGTFKPAEPGGDQNASFRVTSGVHVYGGFAGGETSISQRDSRTNLTILSGDLNSNDAPNFTNRSDNSYHVLDISLTSPETVIDGFTVRGGNALIDPENDRGGAMIAHIASASARDCAFKDNQAFSGGAVAVTGYGFLTFERCTLHNNLAASRGGAFHLSSQGRVTLVDSMIAGNMADVGAAAFVFEEGHAELHSSTVVHNVADSIGGLIVTSDAGIAVTNSILWGNQDNGGFDESAQLLGDPITIDYSSVQGWTGGIGGEGNVGLEPLFIDELGPDGEPGTGDENYRLSAGSPLINMGDPDFVPDDEQTDLDGFPRVLCGRVDIGAYEFGIGDYDCDRDVDLADFAGLPGCLTGPGGGPYADGCEAFDYVFQTNTGPTSAIDLRDVSRALRGLQAE